MRNEPVEIVSQYLASTSCGKRAEALVTPDAVFVDLSPSGAMLRHRDQSNVFSGRSEFLAATSSLLGSTCTGELVLNSLFGSGRNVAGFGTMVRVQGPDLSEMYSPVSLWAKVVHGRICFLQYLEFVSPRVEQAASDVGLSPAVLVPAQPRRRMHLIVS